MSAQHAGRRRTFQDRRMWRLLMASLHPDAGGTHELFLFACALKDEVCPNRLSEASKGGSAPDLSFTEWRSTMDSWASGNRDALRRDRQQRAGRVWDA